MENNFCESNQQTSNMSSSSFPVPDKWMSIYIPIVPSDLSIGGLRMNNEMAFQHFFEQMLPVGKVSRVDFIKRDSKMGDHTITSAFVHFSAWFEESPASKDLRSCLESDDQFRLSGAPAADGTNVLFRSVNNPNVLRFINVKINKAPIQRVTEIPKNIHQIINNYGVMEGVISDQNTRIEELEALVARLRETILEIEESEGPAFSRVDWEVEDRPMTLSEMA